MGRLGTSRTRFLAGSAIPTYHATREEYIYDDGNKRDVLLALKAVVGPVEPYTAIELKCESEKQSGNPLFGGSGFAKPLKMDMCKVQTAGLKPLFRPQHGAATADGFSGWNRWK